MWLRAHEIMVTYYLNGVFLYLDIGYSGISAPLVSLSFVPELMYSIDLKFKQDNIYFSIG